MHVAGLLLVLGYVAVCGLVIAAGEIARPHFIKDAIPHDEDEVAVAREHKRRRRDFDGISELE